MRSDATASHDPREPGQRPRRLPPAPAALSARSLEGVGAVVMAVDAEGRIVFAGPGLERLTGYRVDELTGRSYVDLMVPEALRAQARERLQRQLSGRRSGDREQTLLDCTGEQHVVRWSES